MLLAGLELGVMLLAGLELRVMLLAWLEMRVLLLAGPELGGLRDDRSPEPAAEVRVSGLLLPYLQVPYLPECGHLLFSLVTIQMYRPGTGRKY
jgi:hypothetical protein